MANNKRKSDLDISCEQFNKICVISKTEYIKVYLMVGLNPCYNAEESIKNSSTLAETNMEQCQAEIDAIVMQPPRVRYRDVCKARRKLKYGFV